ncbi:hypothetical protein G6F63_014552 [Rhizopus arrhizus]|nr:hypothetical protein G6F40_014655 [Rhizopus arrhizus]KAG1319806.1 hypothetical protein G6F63_014552 [Rhizopus arrhizus]
MARLLLDRRLGDGTVGILDAQPRGRLAQRIGTVGGVAVAPDPVEQHIHRLCAGAGGQAQAQRRQRVERMARRESQGRTLGLRGPQQLAVDETTLGGNLGRTEVAQVMQHRTEGNRHRLDLRELRQLLQLLPVQVGIRRDEVEVPAQRGHWNFLVYGQGCALRCR